MLFTDDHMRIISQTFGLVCFDRLLLVCDELSAHKHKMNLENMVLDTFVEELTIALESYRKK